MAACGVLRGMVHEKLPVPLPFEDVVQRHEREILRYLLRVSGDRDEAADLFQETWLRAYRAYPRLHPERVCEVIWCYGQRGRDNIVTGGDLAKLP